MDSGYYSVDEGNAEYDDHEYEDSPGVEDTDASVFSDSNYMENKDAEYDTDDYSADAHIASLSPNYAGYDSGNIADARTDSLSPKGNCVETIDNGEDEGGEYTSPTSSGWSNSGDDISVLDLNSDIRDQYEKEAQCWGPRAGQSIINSTGSDSQSYNGPRVNYQHNANVALCPTLRDKLFSDWQLGYQAGNASQTYFVQQSSLDGGLVGMQLSRWEATLRNGTSTAFTYCSSSGNLSPLPANIPPPAPPPTPTYSTFPIASSLPTNTRPPAPEIIRLRNLNTLYVSTSSRQYPVNRLMSLVYTSIPTNGLDKGILDLCQFFVGYGEPFEVELRTLVRDILDEQIWGASQGQYGFVWPSGRADDPIFADHAQGDVEVVLSNRDGSMNGNDEDYDAEAEGDNVGSREKKRRTNGYSRRSSTKGSIKGKEAVRD